MADTTNLIVRNDTVGSVVWGGQLIAPAATYTIQESDRLRLLGDAVFRIALTATDAVISNGVLDLEEDVAVFALQANRASETFTLKRFGELSAGSFLYYLDCPPDVREAVIPFRGFLSGAVVTALSLPTFVLGVNINDVQQDTITFPSQGSPKGQLFTELSIVVEQGDALTIDLNSGTGISDPSILVFLQNF